MRTRIKICGITKESDAVFAAHLGADAIGLVFYTESPRAVSMQEARAIVTALPAFVTSVALFVNPRVADVHSVLEMVGPDCLQFHGEEDAGFCEQFNRPYIKAIRVRQDTDIEAYIAEHPRARAILFDTYVEQVPGGTGQRFDWSAIPADCPKPVILAGGLNPANVAEAIRTVRPYAVDVSGGVEASKGIKDRAKIREFIQEVAGIGTR